MRKLFILLLTVIMFGISAYSKKEPGNFVFVQGGAFKNTLSNYYGKSVTILSFYLGKYEVTRKEWIEVMVSNPSQFKTPICR